MHEVYFVYCLKLSYIGNIFLVGVNCLVMCMFNGHAVIKFI